MELPEQRLINYDISPASVKANLSYEPTFGNPVLHIQVKGQKEIKVSYWIRRKEILTHFSKQVLLLFHNYPFKQFFLKPNDLINAKIQQMAKRITGNAKEILAKAKKIYDFVISYMTYDKHCPGCGQGDLKRILKEKRGNCIDYHSLFMALCGAVGIQTVYEMGIMFPENQEKGVIKGYHSWVKFFLPGAGWVPVDISEADKHPQLKTYYFGNLTPNRVCLSRGRYFTISPAVKKHFNYFFTPIVQKDGKFYQQYKLELEFIKP